MRCQTYDGRGGRSLDGVEEREKVSYIILRTADHFSGAPSMVHLGTGEDEVDKVYEELGSSVSRTIAKT